MSRTSTSAFSGSPKLDWTDRRPKLSADATEDSPRQANAKAPSRPWRSPRARD